MQKKEISKARRNFRRSLIVIACLSALFFASMITMRANRSVHWYVVRNYQDEIFKVDVFKHQLEASLNDEIHKHDVASSLIQKGVFSRIYTNAGIDMMKDNAEAGYPPSQFSYAEILDLTSFSHDPVTSAVIQDEQKKIKARYYYHLAAAENYPPAVEKLKTIPQQ